jgi:predicted dehydrogenase
MSAIGDQLRVGIVGAGLIGRKRALAMTPNQLLVGVFDTDVTKSKSLSVEMGIRNFDTLDSLLKEIGKGGLLVIATTHSSLSAIALTAVEGLINVLIEKPGSTTSASLQAVEVAAKSHGVTVRVGYNHRFHPAILKAKSEIDSGEYGPIQLVRARYGHGGRVGYENEWRANKSISGGGELIDQGSHLLDLALFLGGEFDINYADIPTLYWPMSVEDNVFIAATYKNNARLWLHASWTEWKNLFSLEIFLKTAKIDISGLGGSYGEEIFTLYHMESGLGIPTVSKESYPESDQSWNFEMRDIEEQLSGHDFLGATATDAVEILLTIERIYSK